MDALELPPGLSHDRFDRLGVPLIELFHFRKHMDPGLQSVLFHLKLHMALLRLLGLLLPGIQPQRVAADDIFQRVPVLPGLFQLRRSGFAGRPCFLQALLARREFLAYRLIPVVKLLGGGRQRGQQGAGLRSGGGLHRLLPAQLLHLGCQAPGGARCFRSGLLPLCEGFPELLHFGTQLLQAPAALVDLTADGARPPLLRFQLPPDAVGILQVVLNIGLQHRYGIFQSVWHRPAAASS